MKKKIIRIALLSLLFFVTASIIVYTFPPARHAVKRSYYRGLDMVAPNVPVLLYHDLEENPQEYNSMVIDVDEFDAHMKYLYDNGFTTLTTETLYNFLTGKEDIPKKSVCITFDDGYYSNIEYAYPILKKYGFKATIFLVTSYMSDVEPSELWEFPIMDIESIQETSDVFEFGSHSNNMHFKNDDNIPAVLFSDFETIKADIELSKNLITVPVFSYPYGAYDDKAIQAVQDTGFKMAFTTKPKRAVRNQNTYKIPRFTITPNINMQSFINVVGGYKKHK